MTLGELEGGTRNLGKRENWGIFILRMGDQILWNLMYRKILCFRCSIFNSNWIRGHRGLERGNRNLGNRKSWKTLGVERSGWNLMGRISTSSRYVIYISGTDPLSLGELGGIFSALASTVLLDVLGQLKLVGMSGTCTNWLDNSRFPDSAIWGAGGRGKIETNEVFLTYDWVIGS